MKQSHALAALALVVQTIAVAGYPSSNWLSVEALLLRPSLDYPYTAIAGSDNPVLPLLGGHWIGKYKPPYAWGYRIEAGYRRGGWDVRANWSSWIHTNLFDLSVDGEFLWLPFIHPTARILRLDPGVLTRADEYKCQSIDGEFGSWCCERCSRWSARFFGGVRYARIRYNTAINVLGTNRFSRTEAISDRWESDVQGTGPRAGAGARYALCWGPYLSGDVSAAFLLGTSKGRYLDFLNDTDAGDIFLTADRMAPVNVIIANVEFEFGLGMSFGTWGRLRMDAHAGYLVNYYSEGTVRAQFLDTFSPGISVVIPEPFALDGWNFRLTGRY